jgi:hypothetical protein
MSLPLPPQVLIPVAVVGAIYLFSYLWTFVSGIYNHFIRPGKNIVKRYGAWAVVTGGQLIPTLSSDSFNSLLSH